MVRKCALDFLSGQRIGRLTGGGLELTHAAVRTTIDDLGEPPPDVQAGPQHFHRRFPLQCIELLEPQTVLRAGRGAAQRFAQLSARFLRAHAVPTVCATITLSLSASTGTISYDGRLISFHGI